MSPPDSSNFQLAQFGRFFLDMAGLQLPVEGQDVSLVKLLYEVRVGFQQVGHGLDHLTRSESRGRRRGGPTVVPAGVSILPWLARSSRTLQLDIALTLAGGQVLAIALGHHVTLRLARVETMRLAREVMVARMVSLSLSLALDGLSSQ